MSGGFVRKQKTGDHQMVTFHFIGDVPQEHADAWNDAIFQLKQRFKGNLSGVTVEGHKTPAKYRRRKGK